MLSRFGGCFSTVKVFTKENIPPKRVTRDIVSVVKQNSLNSAGWLAGQTITDSLYSMCDIYYSRHTCADEVKYSCWIALLLASAAAGLLKNDSYISEANTKV